MLKNDPAFEPLRVTSAVSGGNPVFEAEPAQAVQVGKEVGESDEYVDVWIRQNGKDVDNSNCRQQIKDPKFTTVLVCQGIAECKAGDVFNVAISSSSPDKGLGAVAVKPKGEPVIPSIIFSMYKDACTSACALERSRYPLSVDVTIVTRFAAEKRARQE